MVEKDRLENKKEEVLIKKNSGNKKGVGGKGWLKLLPTVIALGLAIFFYFQWQGAKNDNPEMAQKKAQQELVQIVERVGKLVMLPEGEEPILMTIEDESGVDKSKEFFENAKNGDKILIYKEAKKAYLYRPDENKLISVAPVSVGGQVEGESTESVDKEEEKEVEEEFEVVIRNGTTTPGLAGKFLDILEEGFGSLKVVKIEDAGNDDYDQSIIVVGNEKAEEVAKKLEEKYGLKRLELPEWEEPGGDILVILGEDKIGLTEENY